MRIVVFVAQWFSPFFSPSGGGRADIDCGSSFFLHRGHRPGFGLDWIGLDRIGSRMVI